MKMALLQSMPFCQPGTVIDQSIYAFTPFQFHSPQWSCSFYIKL